MTGEAHEKAIEAAQRRTFEEGYGFRGSWEEHARDMVTAYLASLAEQGIVLVPVSEVVAQLESKLGEMELHEHTGDAYDEGYMAAWHEFRAFVQARFAPEASS